MNIVRCNECMWIGREEELTIPGHCPECDGYEGLMDVEAGCYFSDEEIVRLWNLFSEIPINDNDEIEEEFLGYEVGTCRFDVIRYLESIYSGDLDQLMDEADKLYVSEGDWYAGSGVLPHDRDT